MAHEESNVTYEQLADIEREFEDVELEISMYERNIDQDAHLSFK